MNKKCLYILLLALVMVGCMPPATSREPAILASGTPSPTPALPAITHTKTLQTIHATLAVAFCAVSTGGEVLNVRKAPGMDAEIIGGLLPDAVVEIKVWGKEWHKIAFGDGTGYINARFCEAR